MASSFFLTSLTTYTLIPILTDWLSILNLVELDSAMCCKSGRDIFLLTLSSDKFTHEGSSTLNSRKLLNWLIKRNIKMRYLNLVPYVSKVIDSTLLSYLKRHKNLRIRMHYCLNLVKILKSIPGIVCGLDFAYCVNLTDSILNDILPYLSELSSIKIVDSKLTTASIASIIEYCPNLTDIEVYNWDNLNPSYLIDLSNAFSNQLTGLYLDERCGDVEATHAFSVCPNLSSLLLQNCQITTAGIKNISRCPLITDLNIAQCKLSLGDIAFIASKLKFLRELACGPDVGDNDLIGIANNCSQIKYLSVEKCPLITDLGVIKIAEKCLFLERIILDHCTLISAAAINALYEHCPCIYGISIEGVAGLGNLDQFIGSKHSSFEAIEVLETRVISDSKDDYYSMFICHSFCTKMKTLILQGNVPTNEILYDQLLKVMPNTRLLTIEKSMCTDTIASSIIKYCPLIECLNIVRKTTSIAPLLKLVSHYSSQLKQLNIRQCGNICEADLNSLSTHLCNVTSLGLQESHIKDVEVIALIDVCPRITELNLNSCPNITNVSIIHVLTKLGHQLTRLDVEKTLITTYTLREIPVLCTCLRYLNVKKCKGIYNYHNSLMSLLLACSSLDIVEFGLDSVYKFDKF